MGIDPEFELGFVQCQSQGFAQFHEAMLSAFKTL